MTAMAALLAITEHFQGTSKNYLLKWSLSFQALQQRLPQFGAQPAGPRLFCRTPSNRMKPMPAEKTGLGAVALKRQQPLGRFDSSSVAANGAKRCYGPFPEPAALGR